MGDREHGATAALVDQQPVAVAMAVAVAPASAAGVVVVGPALHIVYAEGGAGEGVGVEDLGRR